jgi:RecA-family ATPase
LTGQPIPQREWIVPQWIPMHRATGIYAPPGTGKTLSMPLLCTAAPIGKPWLGLPVRQCKSVLLYCEDDLKEMHERQDAINRFYGVTFDASRRGEVAAFGSSTPWVKRPRMRR